MALDKGERLAAAKEAADVRRMTRPYQREARKWHIAGALLGTGLTVCGISLGLAIFAKRSEPVQSGSPQGCDEVCAANRLAAVRYTCVDHPELRCTRAAGAAQDALASGRCAKAKRALGYIEVSLRDWNQILGSELSQAIRGLEEACSTRTEPPAGAPSPLAPHARIVRLEGDELVPSVEPVFEVHPIEGESPLALWVAPDGAVVVATIPNEDAYDPSVLIYRRSASGAWGAILRDEQKRLRELGRISIFGWTNDFVSVVTEGNFEDVKTFDGMSWGTEFPPVFCEIGDPASYFRTTDKGGVIRLVRRKFYGSGSCPQGADQLGPLRGLFGLGGPSLWALTRDGDEDVLLQSHDSTEWGRWALRRPPESSSPIDDVWVSATGEAFVASSGRILRTNGTRWSTLPSPPIPVSTLWGRSNEDIFGGSSEGLVHFDGARWSKTSYQGRVAALRGTSAAVLVLTTGAGDDAGQAKAPPPSR